MMQKSSWYSFLLAALSPAMTMGQHSASGPNTEMVTSAQYEKIFYVDIAQGNETGNGSRNAPWKNIKAALNTIAVNGKQKIAIYVAQGYYAENNIQLRPGIDIYGGFRSGNWDRNIQRYPTTITGEGKHQILTGANNTRVDGFILANGSIRGNGGAINCEATSPTLTNNIFTGNRSLKPEKWSPKFLHETANDGGAIYGKDGAAPIIRNNLFVGNMTENGRGAAIAFDNKCNPVIDKNVFINNVAGLDDPMRSSDGGAVSIFNWCNAVISNNLFLGNKALSKNDGGAVFVALWSSAKISGNTIVDSESGDDAGALFVGGQEHRYDGPLDPIPSKDKFYVTIIGNQLFGNRNPSRNSGVMRFTMEARGEFTNNITAFNTGIYFQRSEVAVKKNIIMDNFLFIETKEGLNQGSIENNYITGEFQLETPAKVENNWLKDDIGIGRNNKAGFPIIKNDGNRLSATSAIFSKATYTTDIIAAVSFAKNSLVNRVIRTGDKWGIVRSNEGSRITVWSDMNGIAEFNILPSYGLVQP